jgi:hypothetical protein
MAINYIPPSHSGAFLAIVFDLVIWLNGSLSVPVEQMDTLGIFGYRQKAWLTAG